MVQLVLNDTSRKVIERLLEWLSFKVKSTHENLLGTDHFPSNIRYREAAFFIGEFLDVTLRNKDLGIDVNFLSGNMLLTKSIYNEEAHTPSHLWCSKPDSTLVIHELEHLSRLLHHRLIDGRNGSRSLSQNRIRIKDQLHRSAQLNSRQSFRKFLAERHDPPL